MKIERRHLFLIAGLVLVCILISWLSSDVKLGIVTFSAIFVVFAFFVNNQPRLTVEVTEPLDKGKVRQLIAINTGSIPIPLDRVEIGVRDSGRKGRRNCGDIHVERDPHRRILNPGERTTAISFQDPLIISYFKEMDNCGDFDIYGFVFDQQGNEYRSKRSFKLSVH